MNATPEAAPVAAPDAASGPARRHATLLHAPRYRGHSYGDNHPLGIPRVSLTIDLIEAYDAVTPGEMAVTRKAMPAELEWLHTRDYVTAMQRAEALGKVFQRYRDRHNIGNFENPFFAGFFSTPATATYGSIQGAEVVLEGGMAFNPAGGMHHAAPDQARGFCYFNDCALGIMRLRQRGARVLYLDIDAHHGDGVEAAFADDPDVLTVSLHMDTEYGYPFQGGRIEDTGRLGNAVNLPLPKETNDTEFHSAFSRIWEAARTRWQPDCVVVQAGTDALLPDPLGKFGISTQCFLACIDDVIETSPRHGDGTPKLLVLGGGGYHPLALARCWTGVWAQLTGRELPALLPEAGQALLREVDWDMDEEEEWYDNLFVSRLDADRSGPVRAELEQRLERLFRTHPLLRSAAGG
ncbi:acetoin utilization protein AcuC [Thioalkalivibrio sp. ALE11]|uniref:acetoin utilization protein AcuC n=1 Tax=Thioalkalivibrio sp. ALE11 TaxID=1265494 RepID=UPI0003697F5B|nr:acetoin utilization protein AcuC [Thioalkalivibrio sp. ALE11]